MSGPYYNPIHTINAVAWVINGAVWGLYTHNLHMALASLTAAVLALIAARFAW